jgi:predicted site-specific integrase-resolvase
MCKALLTYRDVSNLLDISIPTLKRWIASGVLHPVKLGNRQPGRIRDNRPVRFKISEVASVANIPPQELMSSIDDASTTAKVVEK